MDAKVRRQVGLGVVKVPNEALPRVELGKARKASAAPSKEPGGPVLPVDPAPVVSPGGRG